MYKNIARNQFIFVLLLLLSIGAAAFELISGDRALRHTVTLIDRTYETITVAERLGTLVESMLSAQRGYIMTHEKSFLNEYASYKTQSTELLAKVSELLVDDGSQKSRLDEMRAHMLDFTAQLEERSRNLPQLPLKAEARMGMEEINSIKTNIMRINAALLKEEYTRLNTNVRQLQDRKNLYFSALMIGMCCAAAFILIFNVSLIYAKRRWSHAETSLKDTEDRLRLAIEGAQDGIYDWDMKTNRMFFSRRYYEMLGFERKTPHGTLEDAKSLIHPDDVERTMAFLSRYLSGEISEYSQEFRMQHASGRWIWIQSRGKALYDASGKPYRMVGAHTDITQMAMAQERLKSEKEESIEESRAKTDFIAHMSHEIRTPLTTIAGIAEIFQRNKANLDERQTKLLQALYSSSRTLKDLISDILDFSKIENGTLELEERLIALDELCAEIAEGAAIKADDMGVRFQPDLSGIQGVECFGDKARLRQIIVNLVGNAFKFSKAGGLVTFHAQLEERSGGQIFLRVVVSDTGPGILAEDYELVFERFRQTDSSASRKHGGIGLGLPISRALARMMGGDISLSSQIGQGSSFHLTIPLPGGLKESMQDTGNGREDELDRQIRRLIEDNTRVLIAEDYEGNIVVMGYMMDDLGLSYDVARTGAEALDKWKKTPYSLILMDVQMPDMDGFTATRNIRLIEGQKNMPRTPIVGLTAHALVGDKDKCIQAGMDAYLPKPVIEADLKREILRFIKDGA